MKPFSHQPRAAFAVLFFAVVLSYSCSAAAEDISDVSTNTTSTTENEAPCLNVNCAQVAKCCPTGMDDYGWIAAAVGWSLWFLTLILLCVDKVMKLRPDEHKHLVA
ncbi:Tmem213 [Columba livia]|nr:Tmem213 [Columba livia]